MPGYYMQEIVYMASEYIVKQDIVKHLYIASVNLTF